MKNIRKILILLCAIICISRAPNSHAQDFSSIQVTNDSDGIGLSTAIESDQIYFSHVSINGDLRFSSPSGENTWSTQDIDANLGLPTQDPQIETSLVFISGTAHIIYYNETTNSLKHAYKVADAWQIEEIESGQNLGGYPSAIDCGSSNICICGKDLTSNDLVFWQGTTGDWTRTIIDNSANNVGSYCDLIKTTDNKIVIAYSDLTARKLKIATRASDTWQTESISSSNDEGFWPSIVEAPSGKLEVYYSSYKDSDLGSADQSIIYTSKESGQAWANSYNVESPYVGGYPVVGYDSFGRLRQFHRYLRYSGLFGNASFLAGYLETSAGLTTKNLLNFTSCMQDMRFINLNFDSTNTIYLSLYHGIFSEICGVSEGILLLKAAVADPEATPEPTATPEPSATPTASPTATPTPSYTCTLKKSPACKRSVNKGSTCYLTMTAKEDGLPLVNSAIKFKKKNVNTFKIIATKTTSNLGKAKLRTKAKRNTTYRASINGICNSNQVSIKVR